MNDNHSASAGLDLSKYLGVSDVGGAHKDLIRPGRGVDELLMRTRLSQRELELIVLLLYKIERFPFLEPIKKFILAYLEGKTSVNGMSRKEVVQIATGAVVPDWLSERESRFRKKERVRMEEE